MKKELEIFSTRYSCRNFKNEKLKKEDLNSILEIASVRGILKRICNYL